MSYQHADHLAKFLGVKSRKSFEPELVEFDHETDRERYRVDGVTYDVETVNVRERGKQVARQRVYVVVPIDRGAVGLGADNVCPTCGRPRARAHRRFEVDDAGQARQLHEENVA
jgi:hypothetical protein